MIRVRGLTPHQSYRAQEEGGLLEPAALRGSLRYGATWVEGPREAIEALAGRIEDAEVLSDAGQTEVEAAFARRSAEQSRLALASKLARALGDTERALALDAERRRAGRTLDL